jgi:hypothetical protein
MDYILRCHDVTKTDAGFRPRVVAAMLPTAYNGIVR